MFLEWGEIVKLINLKLDPHIKIRGNSWADRQAREWNQSLFFSKHFLSQVQTPDTDFTQYLPSVYAEGVSGVYQLSASHVSNGTDNYCSYKTNKTQVTVHSHFSVPNSSWRLFFSFTCIITVCSWALGSEHCQSTGDLHSIMCLNASCGDAKDSNWCRFLHFVSEECEQSYSETWVML